MEPVIITVPLKIESMNKTVGRHWSNKSGTRRMWEKALAICGNREVDKRALPYRNVTIISKRRRLIDQDNLIGGAKQLVDSMKALGWIEDDRVGAVKISYDQVKAPDDMTLLRMW